MDYISREDAIELITDKTKRLALSKEADGYGEVEWSAYVVEKREAIAILNALPSADVAEIIKCKECIYSVYPVLAGQMKCKQDGERWVFFDGYCDKAERREE